MIPTFFLIFLYILVCFIIIIMFWRFICEGHYNIQYMIHVASLHVRPV